MKSREGCWYLKSKPDVKAAGIAEDADFADRVGSQELLSFLYSRQQWRNGTIAQKVLFWRRICSFEPAASRNNMQG